MPGLTFHPEHQRHLTLAAAGRCLELYRLLREQAEGRMAASVPGASLLIGIGLDVGVGYLWGHWDPMGAVAAARQALTEGYPGVPAVLQVWPEVEQGIHQYADQWGDGVRGWGVLAVHPYLGAGDNSWLVLPLTGGGTYLCMPDMVARMGGVLTIVDQKTGAWPYQARDWLWEPQLLVNCLALSRAHPGEPVQFLIDYMQRPAKRWAGKGKPKVAADGSGWTFPQVHAVPFTEARRAVAENWLALGAERLEWLRQLRGAGMADFRDPAQCHGRYGLCEMWATCFQGQDGEAEDA